MRLLRILLHTLGDVWMLTIFQTQAWIIMGPIYFAATASLQFCLCSHRHWLLLMQPHVYIMSSPAHRLLAMWLRAVLAATLIDHTVLSTVADTLRCPLCKVDLAPLRSNCVPRLLASRALSLDDGQTLLHLPSALFRHLLRLP